MFTDRWDVTFRSRITDLEVVVRGVYGETAREAELAARAALASRDYWGSATVTHRDDLSEEKP